MSLSVVARTLSQCNGFILVLDSLFSASNFSVEWAPLRTCLTGLVFSDNGLAFGLGLLEFDLLVCLKTGEEVYVFAAPCFLVNDVGGRGGGGGGGGGCGNGILDAFCS